MPFGVGAPVRRPVRDTRRRVLRRPALFVAVAFALGSPVVLAVSTTASAQPAPAHEKAAGGTCPPGTTVVAPALNPQGLSRHPPAALPAGFSQVAANPTFQRAVHDHLRWQTSLSCTPATPPGLEQPAPVSSSDLSAQGSYNWSGYQAQNLVGATGVSGEWQLADLHRAPRHRAGGAVSEWVGVGKGNSLSAQLAQAGSEEQYADGGTRFTYNMFFELYPQQVEQASNFAVAPGDQVGAVVTYNPAAGKVLFVFSDFTAHRGLQVVERNLAGPVGTDSAEWIVERPELCLGQSDCYLPPLANFGLAPFSRATARVRGKTRLAQTLATVRLAMFSCHNKLLARPRAFSAPKKFTVAWRAYGTIDTC